MNKLILILLLVFGLSNVTMAQEKEDGITIKQTIDYLNRKFKGRYVFSIVKVDGDLKIETFKDGKLVKTDIMDLRELDPFSIKFYEEENAIVIKCYKANAGCIDRRIVLPPTHDGYDRTTLLISDPTDSVSIRGVRKAMKHLIWLTKDFNYNSSEPFE